jgi:UDP-N-acetylmuramoyl-L-alanyl-D-glutamate--2,6-diaminopimelate ligase
VTLKEALEGVALRSPIPEGLEQAPVAGLAYDSRRVEPGFVFFAFPGRRFDGREFAPEAIRRGAIAVVADTPPPEDFAGPWIQVEHGRRALALAARNLYGAVLDRLAITGITGTNGKTTTSYLLDSILRAAGKTTALIGTIQYLLAGRPQPAVNTTPESLDLYAIFEQLARRGGTHVTMEVSSHGLALGRVHGVPFHTAVFTNLTRDHLDFHGTMEAYFEAKRLLFYDREAPPPRYAVLNRDDPWARRIEPEAETETLWFGLGDGAAVRAERIAVDFAGVRFELAAPAWSVPVESPLLGTMNVYNILAAAAAALTYGVAAETIAAGVAACRAVPGRFERVDEGQPFLVIVDYAHTDDALRNLIAAARALAPKRILTVFGCGGDRDRAKRPLMGQAAGEASDFVVLTSDNPRSEDPLDIINDALVGLRRTDTPHRIEPDRATAIRIALAEANPGDIVLIAGKGHETYQILKDRVVPFDDREVARAILRSFGYAKESR